MSINIKIEKYIYKFLVYLNSHNYKYAINKLNKKYKIESNYINFIIEECINSGYVNGIKCESSVSNFKHLLPKDYIYVSRKGFSFIYQYRVNILNYFLIPFKNLVIIIITAIITAFFTANISNIIDYFKNLFL